MKKKSIKNGLMAIGLMVLSITFFLPGIAVATSGEVSRRIVLFEKDVDWDDIRAYRKRMKKNLGIKTVMKLPMINGLVLNVPDGLPDKAIIDLDMDIQSIEADEYVHIVGAEKSYDSFIQEVEAPDEGWLSWSLLRFFGQQSQQGDLYGAFDEDLLCETIESAFENLEDRKLRVAFLDTGLNKDHDMVKAIAKDGVDMVNKMVNSDGTLEAAYESQDDNGHGSHVAGIFSAALDPEHEWGQGESGYVELFPVKILDENAIGELSNVIMGVQWAVKNHMDIINMSIGYKHDSPALRRTFEEAAKAGIIMVASAGNISNYDEAVHLAGGMAEGGAAEGGAAEGGAAEGGAAEGGAAEGGAAEGGAAEGGAAEGGAAEGGAAEGITALNCYDVMFPARYESVIAVGSNNRNGKLADFSNRGPELDLMAPGTDIVSADITNSDYESGFGKCSGTSMSAPLVTAAVALIMTVAPDLDSETIRSILVNTVAYSENSPDYGELNLNLALAIASGQNPDLVRKADEDDYHMVLENRIKQDISSDD